MICLKGSCLVQLVKQGSIWSGKLISSIPLKLLFLHSMQNIDPMVFLSNEKHEHAQNDETKANAHQEKPTFKW